MFFDRLFKRSLSNNNASVALLKASAFTGSPSYYETLYFLDDILIRTASLRLQSTTTLPYSSSPHQQIKYTWKSRHKLAEVLQFPLTALQFRRIRQRLNDISEVANRMSEVKEFLRPFVAMESVSRVEVGEDGQAVIVSGDKKQLAYVDEKGRTVAKGKRKEAKARIQLTKVSPVSGEGKNGKTFKSITQRSTVTVNHKPLSTYFMRMRDRVEVCKPFEVTGTFGKYHLNCSVEGGGHTGMHAITIIYIYLTFVLIGQAGAIRFALSKALASIDPILHLILRKEGLMKRDVRRVERKKYGQEKARKKFTWYIQLCLMSCLGSSDDIVFCHLIKFVKEFVPRTSMIGAKCVKLKILLPFRVTQLVRSQNLSSLIGANRCSHFNSNLLIGANFQITPFIYPMIGALSRGLYKLSNSLPRPLYHCLFNVVK